MSINRSIADLLRSHSTIPTAGAPGKNLIQNGAMTVNQRSSGIAVAADNTFAIDRYSNRLIGGGPARWTVTQDTTVPAGEGFGYSHKIDVTTIDASISTDDYHGITHTIEAKNLQHLNFNHADASALTLTFWARTKKAGLHGGAIYNNDANRSLVFSWTAVADTWQKVTVAVPGDTSGVINNDSGAGLTIYWSLSGGKYMASNTGAWVAGAYLSVTSAVNDFDHVDNDFYLTGVQLEVGSAATDFEHEGYGTTLNKCYRYMERIGPQSTSAGYTRIGTGFNATTTTIYFDMFYTPKRAVPTITSAGTCYANAASGGGTVGTGAISGDQFGPQSALCLLAGGSSLVLGRGASVALYNNGISFVTISAEL